MVIEIKIILKKIGNNAKWLSKDTGVTEKAISEICNGKREPTEKTLQRIAESLNVAIRKFNKTAENVVKEVEVYEFRKIVIERTQLTYRLK